MFVRYLYRICPGKALPLELYLREPFPRENGLDSDVCEKGEKSVSRKISSTADWNAPIFLTPASC